MKPFGITSKIKPGSMKTITSSKLATFVVGQQKKTRFTKEKEAREAKEKAEMQEAAGIYEDFVASFEGGGNSKTFVRDGSGGGTSGKSEGANEPLYRMDAPSSSSSSSSSSRSGGSSSSSKGAAGASKKPMSEMERMLEEMKDKQEGRGSDYGGGGPLPPPGPPPLGGGNRGGFSNGPMGGGGGGFMGGPPPGGSFGGPMGGPPARGSHDDGGGDSTNLYVGNLAPTTTEETLNEIFGKFGEIYSVKIMWPRTDEERARKRNCGFVSFMVRGDAADAKEAMHNADVEGYVLSVGWGKAIKNLKSNPSILGQAGGFLKVRTDTLPPGLGEELTDKLSDAIRNAKEAAAKAQKEKVAKDAPTSSAAPSPSFVAGGGGGDGGGSDAGAGAFPASVGISAQATANRAVGLPAGCAGAPPAGGGGAGEAPTSGGAGEAGGAGLAAAFPSAGGAPGAISAGATTTTATAAFTAAAASVNPKTGKVSKWDVGAGGGGGAGGKAGSVAVEREMGEDDEKVEVQFPSGGDGSRRSLIDLLALHISKDGQPLANMIKEREAANPEYECLHDPSSADATYFRWKVYTLVMGDREKKWRVKPFQMTAGGAFWVPPPLPEGSAEEQKEGSSGQGGGGEEGGEEGAESGSRRDGERRRQKEREAMRKERYKFATGAQLEKAREQQERDRRAKLEGGGGDQTKSKKDLSVTGGRPLSDGAYDDWEQILRDLTTGSKRVAEAMAFALDYADCSGDVVELLEGSLLVEATPLNVKVARLFVVSDLLHNSAAPVKFASTYRTLLQHCLPKIFDHLNAVLRNPLLGRMSSKSFEDRVLAVLQVWHKWGVFDGQFLGGLEATFLRRLSDLDGDALAILKGVTHASAVDLEKLKRDAVRGGVYFDEKDDDALRLFKKVTFAEEYLKIKNQSPYGGGGEGEGGDDLDGTPLADHPRGLSSTDHGHSTNPLLAAAAAAVESGGNGDGARGLTGVGIDTAGGSEAVGGGAGREFSGQWGVVDDDDDDDEEEEDVDGMAMDDGDDDDDDVDGTPMGADLGASAAAAAAAAAKEEEEAGKEEEARKQKKEERKRRKKARQVAVLAAKKGSLLPPSKYSGLGSSRFSDESGGSDDSDSEDESDHEGSGGGGTGTGVADHLAESTSSSSSSAGCSGNNNVAGLEAGAPAPAPMTLSREAARKVEVALLGFRDDLEETAAKALGAEAAAGSGSGLTEAEVDAQCAAERKRLVVLELEKQKQQQQQQQKAAASTAAASTSASASAAAAAAAAAEDSGSKSGKSPKSSSSSSSSSSSRHGGGSSRSSSNRHGDSQSSSGSSRRRDERDDDSSRRRDDRDDDRKRSRHHETSSDRRRR